MNLIGFEKYQLDNKKLFTFFIFATLIAMSQINVHALFFLSSFLTLVYFYRDNKAAVVFFVLALSASNNITLAGFLLCSLILFFYLLTAENFSFKTEVEGFFCFFLLFFYLVLTCLYSFFHDVDFLYFDYFKRNVYKEFILPLFTMLTLVCLKVNGLDYFKALLYSSFIVTFTQIFSMVSFQEVSFYLGAQFSLSLIIFFLSNNSTLRKLSLINVCVYIYLLLANRIYFSSQDVMLVLLVALLYLFIYKRLIFVVSIGGFILFYYFFGFFDVHTFLKEVLGLDSAVSFKLSQIFIVLQSASFSDIPWSPRVRLVELINTFSRNPFEVFFGSGFVSYIGTDLVSFIQNNYDSLGIDDFHQLEISSGKFYGLHNTSRGVLHYGLFYFFVAAYFFYSNLKKTENISNVNLFRIANIYFFAVALWNPNVFFLFLLTMLKKCVKRNEV